MQERSKFVSNLIEGCVDLCKENPVVALGFAATAVAVTYVYRNNYLSFWGTTSEPPIKQTIKGVTGRDSKIRQDASKLAEQSIDDIDVNHTNVEQSTSDGKNQTPGFPSGQSNH